MLIEIIALLISYLGVFVGFKLSEIAKEEIVPGKKNLVILLNGLYILALLWFFYSVPVTLLYKIILAVVLVVVYLLFKKNYSVLGLMFGLNPDFLMASLIFLYGFPAGSLMLKENYVSIIKKTIVYVVFGAIGLIVRNYFII